MILKSLSRKLPSFSQLLSYIQKDAVLEQGFFHNFDVGRGYSNEEIISQYRENYESLEQNRSRGHNSMYHEILSLKRSHDVSLELLKRALLDITHDYIEARGENLLYYGNIHYDSNSAHIHLMVSSNELGSERRHRINKHQFHEIQRTLEQKIQERYPELEQETVYNKEFTKEREHEKEFQLKKRGQQTQREKIKELLEYIYTHARTEDEYKQALKHYHITPYQRGVHHGIILDGKKHRLKKLGLVEEYERLQRSFVRQEELEHMETREPEKQQEAEKEPTFTTEEQKQRFEELQNLEASLEQEDDLELEL